MNNLCCSTHWLVFFIFFCSFVDDERINNDKFKTMVESSINSFLCGGNNVFAKNKGINVVSLFNGMGTLRQAFADLNIKVNNYYSSEIKPYAIELQQHHFKDVIQVGDINNWKEWDIDWKSIDFIGSGSPCQDLSIAGERKGIDGNRSNLFFTFVEIYEYVKILNPNVIFLQENVGSAPRLDVGIMSRALGVYPARINSKLLTAQLRDRYYWTNTAIKQDGMFGDIVSDIPQPKNLNIKFEDIIESGYVKRLKGGALLESDYKCFVKDQVKENILIQKRLKKGKQTPNLIYLQENNVRTISKIEMCRMQGFKDNYCDILTKSKACSLLGDGWTLPIIIHILSFLLPDKAKEGRKNY